MDMADTSTRVLTSGNQGEHDGYGRYFNNGPLEDVQFYTELDSVDALDNTRVGLLGFKKFHSSSSYQIHP